MEIIHNKVFRVNSDELKGLFRIIVSDLLSDVVVLANIDFYLGEASLSGVNKKRGKHASSYRSNKLVWIKYSTLLKLDQSKCAVEVDIELDYYKMRNHLNTREQSIYNKRVSAMRGFLSYENLKHRILTDENLKKLVEDAQLSSEYSKPQIHKLFGKLCQYGFTEKAFKPEYHLSGAPGVRKFCGPNQKKLGARTIKEKIDINNGIARDPTQPGMTAEWERLILAADASIKRPKPKMPARAKIILASAFVTGYTDKNGLLVPQNLILGSYPNARQIRRTILKNNSVLKNFEDKTTSRNFILNHRALIGKSYEGVSGPGHTYVIDSTIGDVYLRSSINIEWIIGRPIVYIIVDDWSTAIVGFYVCLSGPSWDMAKIAIFCSVASSSLIADLRGVDNYPTLNPHPTLPAVMLCDRGEYLSLAAKQTQFDLKMIANSFTPPYRGDLKGVNEVLHRIEKDHQYAFVPGAIDARRKEYELRKFNPNEAIFTIRDYTQYLHSVFSNYNLTADRTHRLDAHMKAADMRPCPSGLWNWGHKVGIGTQIHRDPSDLYSSLLLKATANVTSHGLKFDNKIYSNKTNAELLEAAIARNSGSFSKQIFHYPGSLSRIWTPSSTGKGLDVLSLLDHSTASPDTTLEEDHDAHAYSRMKNEQTVHENTSISLGHLNTQNRIIKEAASRNKSHISSDDFFHPTITEARKIEKDHDLNLKHSAPEKPDIPNNEDSSSSEYAKSLQLYLDKINSNSGGL